MPKLNIQRVKYSEEQGFRLLSFYVDDPQVGFSLVVYFIGENRTTCSCRQTPCRHAAALYEFFSPSSSLEILKYLLRWDIPRTVFSNLNEITQMLNAFSRHFNLWKDKERKQIANAGYLPEKIFEASFLYGGEELRKEFSKVFFDYLNTEQKEDQPVEIEATQEKPEPDPQPKPEPKPETKTRTRFSNMDL